MELCPKNLYYSMEQLKIILSNKKFPMKSSLYNRYTKPDATMAEVRAAAEEANALDFIENNQFGMKFFN